MARRVLIALTSLVLVTRSARAEPCTVDAWRATSGAVVAAPGCAGFVATTDGSPSSFSYGRIEHAQPLAIPYRVTLAWRRLGAERRTLELDVGGAIVLFRDGQLAFYVDNAQFQITGWQPLPGLHTRRAQRVSVRRDRREVRVALDGVEVARWQFPTDDQTVRFAIAFKGGSGQRARMWFGDVAIAQ